jgi:glycerol-3-phosphate acyltransferase PlsY
LWIFGYEKVAAVMAIMSVISYYKHKANISRLIGGTESKIGAKG